jgi:protein TonB
MNSFLQSFTKLSVFGYVVLLAARPAAAQTAAAPAKVYTYVEQMPHIPGDNSVIGIVKAIQQRVVYPPNAIREQVQGRIFVSFVVAADGQVQRVAIVKGLRPDCDSAAVWAVRQLPRFEPGLQKGQPVAVAFTAPISFSITAPSPPKPGLTPR